MYRLTALHKIWPLLPIAIVVVIYLVAGWDDYFTFTYLNENRDSLRQWTEENLILSITLFLILYFMIVTCFLPGAAFLTLCGGFIFGSVLATVVVVISATLGSAAVFLIARYVLAEFFRGKMGDSGKRIESGFNENALSYLLFLRLVPIFPFWLVNIVPALLGVPLKVYLLGTFFGIIPGSAVYSSMGSGLDIIFETGGQLNLGVIFEPSILGPFVGLGVLSLLPIIYRRIN